MKSAIAIVFALLFAAPAAWAGKTRNVVLVIADGVHRVRDADVFRRGRGAQILPGLEQQHAMRWVFAEARG